RTTVVWEHRIWAKTGLRGQSFGVELVGEKGTLVVDDRGWRGENGTLAGEKGSVSGGAHLRRLPDRARHGKRPRAHVEEGHRSTRLCHLGNIAYRLGRALTFDATTETVPGDAEANRLLSRAYRKPFVLPEKV